MKTVAPITEQFQHLVRDLRESFWGDLYGQARGTLEKFLSRESVRLRDEAVGCERFQQKEERRGQRNGFYFRDFVSRFGTLRLQVARTREGSFLPGGLARFQRRAEEVMLLIREAFLRGLSTRQVGLAAIQTVYPRVLHQRCWVHKMRNISEAVRRRDHDPVKQEAQKIYRAGSLAEAERAFRRFQWNGQRAYPAMVRRLEKDLPALRTFFRFPRHLWRKLRSTNVIERCFVEVRRRTRPLVCFVNVESVDRIIYAIFNALNDPWRNRTLRIFTQAA